MKEPITEWSNYQIELRIQQLNQQAISGPLSERQEAREELNQIALEQKRREAMPHRIKFPIQ